MPMIAFIGVRISWLMLARNSLFSRADSSAFWRASRSRSTACWIVSACRRTAFAPESRLAWRCANSSVAACASSQRPSAAQERCSSSRTDMCTKVTSHSAS